MKSSVPAKSLKKAPADPRSTVLVIENSSEVGLELKELLELEGVSVVTRSSGASGIRELQTGRRYGLVLLDFNLTDMSADEILAELQSHNLADQQPIVGLSTGREVKRKSHLAAVIRKPVDVVDLTKQIRRYLTLH